MSDDLKHRLGGILCLALAGGIGWFAVWRPLQQAQEHAAQVSMHTKAIVLVPFAAVFGLFFLIFGNGVPYRDEAAKKLKPTGWALVAIAGLVALGGWWWVDQQFSALGYQ